MRVKALQGFANDIAQMAVSERALPLYRAVADFPDDPLQIDLIAGIASSGSVVLGENEFVLYISSWLRQRFHEIHVTRDHVAHAKLLLVLDSSQIPTLRSRLILYLATPSTSIAVGGRTYESSLPPQHVWVTRLV